MEGDEEPFIGSPITHITPDDSNEIVEEPDGTDDDDDGDNYSPSPPPPVRSTTAKCPLCLRHKSRFRCAKDVDTPFQDLKGTLSMANMYLGVQRDEVKKLVAKRGTVDRKMTAAAVAQANILAVKSDVQAVQVEVGELRAKIAALRSEVSRRRASLEAARSSFLAVQVEAGWLVPPEGSHEHSVELKKPWRSLGSAVPLWSPTASAFNDVAGTVYLASASMEGGPVMTLSKCTLSRTALMSMKKKKGSVLIPESPMSVTSSFLFGEASAPPPHPSLAGSRTNSSNSFSGIDGSGGDESLGEGGGELGDEDSDPGGAAERVENPLSVAAQWESDIPLVAIATGLDVPSGGVIAGGIDGSVVAWLDPPNKEVELPSHDNSVSGVVVMPDRRTVVVGSADKTLRVSVLDIDVDLHGYVSGSFVLHGHEGGVNGLTVLDARRVVSSSDDGTVRVWNTDQLIMEAVLNLDKASPPNHLLPTSPTSWVVNEGNGLSMWDLNAKSLSTPFSGVAALPGPILGLVSLPGGAVIVASPHQLSVVSCSGEEDAWTIESVEPLPHHLSDQPGHRMTTICSLGESRILVGTESAGVFTLEWAPPPPPDVAILTALPPSKLGSLIEEGWNERRERLALLREQYEGSHAPELARLRASAARSLQEIWPLSTVPGSARSVIGKKPLPNAAATWADMDPEYIAATLGDVAKFTSLAAAYLGLTSRHDLDVRIASRSTIRTLGPEDSKFPLFMRGSSRIEFTAGLTLLASEIVNLASASGVEVPEQAAYAMIQNLLRVLCSPYLGLPTNLLPERVNPDIEAGQVALRRSLQPPWKLAHAPKVYTASGAGAAGVMNPRLAAIASSGADAIVGSAAAVISGVGGVGGKIFGWMGSKPAEAQSSGGTNVSGTSTSTDNVAGDDGAGQGDGGDKAWEELDRPLAPPPSEDDEELRQWEAAHRNGSP